MPNRPLLTTISTSTLLQLFHNKNHRDELDMATELEVRLHGMIVNRIIKPLDVVPKSNTIIKLLKTHQALNFTKTSWTIIYNTFLQSLTKFGMIYRLQNSIHYGYFTDISLHDKAFRYLSTSHNNPNVANNIKRASKKLNNFEIILGPVVRYDNKDFMGTNISDIMSIIYKIYCPNGITKQRSQHVVDNSTIWYMTNYQRLLDQKQATELISKTGQYSKLIEGDLLKINDLYHIDKSTNCKIYNSAKFEFQWETSNEK